jgi:hypothetical protein
MGRVSRCWTPDRSRQAAESGRLARPGRVPAASEHRSADELSRLVDLPDRALAGPTRPVRLHPEGPRSLSARLRECERSPRHAVLRAGKPGRRALSGARSSGDLSPRSRRRPTRIGIRRTGFDRHGTPATPAIRSSTSASPSGSAPGCGPISTRPPTPKTGASRSCSNAVSRLTSAGNPAATTPCLRRIRRSSRDCRPCTNPTICRGMRRS